MIRRTRLHEDNVRYVELVLNRDRIRYSIKNEEGVYYLFCDLSQRHLKEVLKDALCEKEREKNKSTIPVYSWETVTNSGKLRRLQKVNGVKSFHVLAKDVEKYGLDR